MNQIGQNACHIDRYYMVIKELLERQEAVELKCEELKKYATYMNQLIKVLQDNPGLQGEWVDFLRLAGIEEPSWKTEYETLRLRDT